MRTGRNKHHLSLTKTVISMLALLAVLCISGLSVWAASPNVAYHTPAEIRTYFNNNGPTSTAITYDIEPSITAPFAAGQLSDATQQNALKQLNFQRYIAGLADNVTLAASNSTEAQEIQAGTLVNAVNKKLTHEPVQPEGMDNALYQLGYNGSGKSNIACGQQNLVAAVQGWMDDEDPGNIDVVGHRRWILNPEMGKTVFGACKSDAYTWYDYYYYAMWSFDDSANGTQTGVCWPAQSMPREYFASDIPWSISMGSTVNASAVNVTLTRRSDNKTWTFSSGTSEGDFYVNNDYYGQPGCIIFRPNDIDKYYNGDVFDVTITGISPQISYTVTFFTLSDYSVAFSQDSYELAAGEETTLTLTANPSSVLANSRVIYTSSDETVATVTADGVVKGVGRGTATITAVCGDKTAECTVTVREPIDQATITFPENVTYTGEALTPDFTVTYDGAVLTPDTDYIVESWENNTNASSEGSPAGVTIAGTGVFTGTLKGTFAIQPADFAGVRISIANGLTKYYTGSTVELVSGDFTASFNGQNVSAENYDLTYENNLNAGTATAVFTGKRNYTGSKEVQFTIQPADIGSTTISGPETQTYTGERLTPPVTVTFNGVALAEGTDYVLVYSNNIDASYSTNRPASVVIQGQGNFGGAITKSFNINRAPVDSLTVEYADTVTYTGQPITPHVMAKLGERVMSERYYSCTYTDNTNVGTGKITLTGEYNLKDSRELTFTIAPKPLDSANIAFSDESIEYTGKEVKPELVVTIDGLSLQAGTDYTAEYSNNIAVGTGNVKITGCGNFTGTAETTFTISQLPLSSSLVQASISGGDVIFYTGSPLTPTVQLTLENGSTPIPLAVNTDYEIAYSDNINAGTGKATMTGKGNYTGSKEVQFTIQPADIGSTTIIGPEAQTYTGESLTPPVTVTFNGVTLAEDADYMLVYLNNIDAGNSTGSSASMEIQGQGNFGGSITKEFDIRKASVESLTLEYEDTATYTGQPVKPSVTAKLGERVMAEEYYSCAYTDNTNVGTGRITLTGEYNLEGSRELTFTIGPKSLAGANIAFVNGSIEYTGKEVEPELVVTIDGLSLQAGTDYTAEYSNNTEVGTGNVKITGCGNFTGTAETTFTISQLPLSSSLVQASISGEDDIFYTGSALAPSVQLTLENGSTPIPLTLNTDYEIAYSDNINAGTGKATMTGKGNYTGSKEVQFTIQPADIGSATISDPGEQTYTYNGNPITPPVTVTFNGVMLSEGADYVLTYSNNTYASSSAGSSASVKMQGQGNFGGSVTKEFEIKKASVENLTLDYKDTATYTGQPIRPSVTAKLGELVMAEAYYSCAYTDNTNVGSGKIKLTGEYNLEGSRELTFTIGPKSLAGANIAFVDESIEYTGEEVKPELVVTIDGLSLQAGTDYTAEYSNNIAVGTGNVKITGCGNFTGTAETTFAINPADINKADVEPIPAETYTSQAYTPALSVMFGNAKLEAGLDYEASYTGNTNAGTATVTLTGKGSFTGTKEVHFTIKPASLKEAVVTVILEEPVKYTGEAIIPSVTVTLNGQGLVVDTDYILTFADNINAGTASCTVTGKGNYTDAVTKTFTISPIDITGAQISLSEETYTGAEIKPSTTVTLNGKRLVEGVDYTPAYTNNINAGTAHVTVSGKGNYFGNQGADFTINKASLQSDMIAPIADQYETGSAVTPAVKVTWHNKSLVKGQDYTVSFAGNDKVGTATVTIKAVEGSNFTGSAQTTFRILEKKTQAETEKTPQNETGKTPTKETEKTPQKETEKTPQKETEKESGGQTSPTGPVGKGANAAYAQKAMESLPAGKDDLDGMTFVDLQARYSKVKKNSLTIKWKGVPGAVSYKVMGNKCGQKYQLLATVTKTSYKWTALNGAKLKKGTYYKAVVIAVDRNGRTLATSKSIHAATKGKKVGNAKKVTVKKKTVKLKKGKTYKIKAKAVAESGKKMKRHRKILFESSDPTKATVNSKGKVKAISKGSCTIYCYTQNGVFAKVKIKIK